MSNIDQKIALPIPSFSLSERLICRWAARLGAGQLTLRFESGREAHFTGDLAGPSATISFNSMKPLRRLMSGGSLGFATSYLRGEWETPDLGAVLDLALANEKHWSSIMAASPLAAVIARFRHRLNRNSKSGSRRNIAFHYDLGNSFYRLWLDETMTYSAALFTDPHQTLADAQRAKYQRIIDELQITEDDHVLEIGCGWGGFAEQAIRETGCRVTGLTLSKEQAAFAENRLREAGLADRADIRLEDYRDCRGTFTKIVSIEMFEAVGEENWPTYFDRVKSLLAKNGKALIQSITIAEHRFVYYRSHADFIQAYIFPGGMLPSVTAFENGAEKAGLAVADCFRFGRDYERTLLLWDKAFRETWQQITPLGFDAHFHRMWHYYLQYCAAGFRSGRLDVVQFTLVR